MRQNLIIVLLSVIATLLLVIALQKPAPVALGQVGGGGTAAIGTEIVGATGAMPGGAAGSAFWLYDKSTNRVAVYYMGNGGLELRAVRDIKWDIQGVDMNLPAGKPTPVAQVRKAVVAEQKKSDEGKKAKKAGKKEEEPEEEGDGKDGKK